MHFRPIPLRSARALLAVLGLLTGCKTTTYVLQVDAISQSGQIAPEGGEPRSYRVHSHDPRVAEDSLRYREVSGYIKTALSGKGLYEAPTAESADLIIDIDYGMETPRMKYQKVIKPIVAIRTGGILREQAGGSVRQPSRPNLQVAMTNSIVGWMEETEPVVVYEKYLKVSAHANRESVEGRPAPEIWSVNVSAEDDSNEVRKYMPILASATADFIGTNTRQEKEVAIHERDETVMFIKKGM